MLNHTVTVTVTIPPPILTSTLTISFPSLPLPSLTTLRSITPISLLHKAANMEASLIEEAPTTSASSTPTLNPERDHARIVGIVVGVLVAGFLLLAFLICCCKGACRKPRPHHRQQDRGDIIPLDNLEAQRLPPIQVTQRFMDGIPYLGAAPTREAAIRNVDNLRAYYESQAQTQAQGESSGESVQADHPLVSQQGESSRATSNTRPQVASRHSQQSVKAESTKRQLAPRPPPLVIPDTRRPELPSLDSRRSMTDETTNRRPISVPDHLYGPRPPPVSSPRSLHSVRDEPVNRRPISIPSNLHGPRAQPLPSPRPRRSPVVSRRPLEIAPPYLIHGPRSLPASPRYSHHRSQQSSRDGSHQSTQTGPRHRSQQSSRDDSRQSVQSGFHHHSQQSSRDDTRQSTQNTSHHHSQQSSRDDSHLSARAKRQSLQIEPINREQAPSPHVHFRPELPAFVYDPDLPITTPPPPPPHLSPVLPEGPSPVIPLHMMVREALANQTPSDVSPVSQASHGGQKLPSQISPASQSSQGKQRIPLEVSSVSTQPFTQATPQEVSPARPGTPASPYKSPYVSDASDSPPATPRRASRDDTLSPLLTPLDVQFTEVSLDSPMPPRPGQSQERK